MTSPTEPCQVNRFKKNCDELDWAYFEASDTRLGLDQHNNVILFSSSWTKSSQQVIPYFEVKH